MSSLLTKAPNSIGFIRLTMAALVLFGHAFHYGGFGIDPLIIATGNQVAIGRFPVDVFFSLSGFLIAASFKKTLLLRTFCWHRFLRIYPAYWICILVTTFFIGPLFGTGFDFSYLFHNIPLVIGVDQSFDGLFFNNIGGSSVNSSLWTLPWELRCYIILAFLGLVGLLNRRLLILTLFMVTWFIFAITIMIQTSHSDLTAITTWPRLFTFFFAGVTFFVFRDLIVLRLLYVFICLIVLLVATVFGLRFLPVAGGAFYLVAPVALTYVFFYLSSLTIFSHINSTSDISYGLYIYSSPVLQVLTLKGFNYSFWQYLMFAYFLSWCLAFVSWSCIEKPALKFKYNKIFM